MQTRPYNSYNKESSVKKYQNIPLKNTPGEILKTAAICGASQFLHPSPHIIKFLTHYQTFDVDPTIDDCLNKRLS